MKKNKKISALKKDIIIIFLIFSAIIMGLIMLWISTFRIPDLQSFNDRIVAQSTKIYDNSGDILLYDVHQNIKRTIVPFSDISDYMKHATISIEDEEFYQHIGVKPLAFLRAVIVNLMSGSFSQGGSTITQQVIKNSVLTQDKTITRKIKEWVLAIKLEKEMSKDEILNLYLNEAPYGGSIYGVEEASESFFGKKAKDLTIAEAAYLAAIPQAPTYYSPYGENKEQLDTRKNLVLKKMLDNKYITDEEYAQATKEDVKFVPKGDMGIKAPHFVMFIKDYLEKKYGERVLEEGGLKVITTLDYELQAKAEEIVKQYALENEQKFNAENGAIVAIDAKTGQILVMVGSRDYFDKEIDGNFNVATAHRQPGSSFKPFVYATAFNEGYTPDTVLFDVPTEFSTYCNPDSTPILPQDADKCYSPVNYDGLYKGPMTLRNALAQSENVPAVKLLYLTGMQNSLKTAKDMGISSLGDINQYGLTLVLGGGEVSLLDMTSAYSVFANDGVKNPYTGILRIEDSNGKVLEEFRPKPTRVLPEKSAEYISSILSDNVARTPEFGANSPLYFGGRDVADKTGTTNDYRDAWTVGYIPQVAVGAWAGNNDNTSMEKKIAGFIVTPMWNAFMQEILRKYPEENFKQPDLNYDKTIKPVIRGLWQGGATYTIDKFSGKLATEYTPEEAKEEKVVQDFHSILYWVDKNNPLGPAPTNPSDDPQYERWEYGVQKWLTENGIVANNSAVPSDYDTIHTQTSKPQIKVISPSSTKEYNPSERINIMVSNNSYSGYPLSKINYYVNGEYIGSSNTTIFSFVPSEIKGIKDVNELRIVGFDSVMNQGETTISFKLDM